MKRERERDTCTHSHTHAHTHAQIALGGDETQMISSNGNQTCKPIVCPSSVLVRACRRTRVTSCTPTYPPPLPVFSWCCGVNVNQLSLPQSGDFRRTFQSSGDGNAGRSERPPSHRRVAGILGAARPSSVFPLNNQTDFFFFKEEIYCRG